MSRVSKPRARNLGELLGQLGVPASRVRLDPPPGRATKRDLLRIHGTDGKLYELVDRTLVEKPMGSPESYLALELARLLGNHVADRDLGFLYGADSLIEMLPGVVRGPDVCFVPWSKWPERTVPTEPISDLIPDLAVEILSSSDTRAESRRKVKEYFLAGVRLVWVLSPKTGTADVYTAPDEKTTIPATGSLDGGDVVPGFRMPLATLFGRLGKPSAKKPRKRK